MYISRKIRHAFILSAALMAIAGCSGGGSQMPATSAASQSNQRQSTTYGTIADTVKTASFISARGRLGSVLTSADGGQIFGYDIDQSGNDGVLATAQIGGAKVSVETFDENTGVITKSFAQAPINQINYVADGIFAGDVGLITRETVQKNGSALRSYDVMNPVTAEKFTAAWTPPLNDIDVYGGARVPATSTSALFAIELQNQDKPDIIVSDIASNTFGKVIHLNPALFGVGNGPQFARDTFANQAVLATSPDNGARNGVAPVNALFDLTTGRETKFNGYNNGPDGAGGVSGVAVDPNTGVAATTTVINAQLELYDLARHFGIAAVQLPCTGPLSLSNSGGGITVDPIHKLFLVSNAMYACTGGSAVLVYSERGVLEETITGFNFGYSYTAINPSKRMGWVGGPTIHQLQQFFY